MFVSLTCLNLKILFMIKITYYLDLISSWCHYVEPVWTELKSAYADVATFRWEIAQIPPEGLPSCKAEEEWYYRRSGILTRQSQMLNAEWVEPGVTNYNAPNLVAVAARELGVEGDEVRLALSKAAMIDGRKIASVDVCVDVACGVCELDRGEFHKEALSQRTAEIVRVSTAKFSSYGINQRPAFHIESEIEDRALFSGIIHKAPIVAAIEAMLQDVQSYRAWSAHMGTGWKQRINVI